MNKRVSLDKNHKRLVKYLKRIGFTVFDCASFGKGFPDLVVVKFPFTFMVEIKNDALDSSKIYNYTKSQLKLYGTRNKDNYVLGNNVYIIQTEVCCNRLLEMYKVLREKLGTSDSEMDNLIRDYVYTGKDVISNKATSKFDVIF